LTGEAGKKSIEDGFPCFNVFDEVMGHRDSVAPWKITIEGSATFANGESGASNAVADVTEISKNSSIEETPSTATDTRKKERQTRRVEVGLKGRGGMLKMVTLHLNGRQSFLKCGSAVWKKTTLDTKGPLKCFREAQNKQMVQNQPHSCWIQRYFQRFSI